MLDVGGRMVQNLEEKYLPTVKYTQVDMYEQRFMLSEAHRPDEGNRTLYAVGLSSCQL